MYTHIAGVLLSQGRVRTKTVKRSARQIVERFYSKLGLDFHDNKKVRAGRWAIGARVHLHVGGRAWPDEMGWTGGSSATLAQCSAPHAAIHARPQLAASLYCA